MKYCFHIVFLLTIMLCLCIGSVFAEDPEVPIAIGIDSSGEEAVIYESEWDSSDDAADLEPHVGEFPPDEDEIPSYAIFGSDDRDKYYYGTTTYPYSAVVYITTDQGVCSGFMIGPHYAATAAHCLYDDYQGWADIQSVCPGSAGSNKPYGCATANYKWIMGGYNYGRNRDYDVGLIRLDQGIGNSSGWLGSYQLSNSECYSYVMIMGNHGSYHFRSLGYLNGTTYNGKLLKYQLDTLPGSSGGPIVMYHNNEWSYIVGINVSHDSGSNYAVRFDNDVYNFLHPYWGK